MILSEFKEALKQVKELKFNLPNGSAVEKHFHVTEIGKINKHFIDCGGTIRDENVINFQLWAADDYDHRFAPTKLLGVIEMSENILGIQDGEIEVEYQGDTIGKYNLSFANGVFQLENKFTDCLAKDNCGVPEKKEKISLAELQLQTSCCDPNSGCC